MITLYTLNLHNVPRHLYLNKDGKNVNLLVHKDRFPLPDTPAFVSLFLNMPSVLFLAFCLVLKHTYNIPEGMIHFYLGLLNKFLFRR